MMKGSTDTYSVKRNPLDIPIVGANMLRVVPFSQYTRTVCLRFELYGCPYQGKLCLSSVCNLLTDHVFSSLLPLLLLVSHQVDQ